MFNLCSGVLSKKKEEEKSTLFLSIYIRRSSANVMIEGVLPRKDWKIEKLTSCFGFTRRRVRLGMGEFLYTEFLHRRSFKED